MNNGDDSGPNYNPGGLGQSFSELAPVKPAKHEHDPEAAKSLREAMKQRERLPDAIDAHQAGAVARAVDLMIPYREKQRLDQLRQDGRVFAEGQREVLERSESEQNTDWYHPNDVSQEEYRRYVAELNSEED